MRRGLRAAGFASDSMSIPVDTWRGNTRDYSQFEDAFSHLRHYQYNYNHPPGSSKEKAALKVRAFAEQVCKASSDLYPDWFNDLPD